MEYIVNGWSQFVERFYFLLMAFGDGVFFSP